MEHTLLNTVHAFMAELQPIKTHRPDTGLTLTLAVGSPNRYLPNRYESTNKPKIELVANFYDGANHQTVKAASLDSLMNEVKRRLGFEDRESVQLQSLEESFVALPGVDQ